MKKLIAFVVMALPLFAFAQKDIDQRVEEIMAKMTIEDKIGQLNQMDGRRDLEQIKKEVREGTLSSIMNIVDPAVTNELQRIAIEESPAGIPLLFARDVVHGFNTVLPIPLGQAASWDEELIEKASRNTALEATERGIRWAFAPMMDIARDARWGRIAESFGEDTYMAGRLATAVVRGYQGNSLSDQTSMAACAKHFVGYGDAEGGRDYNTTSIPPRTLRDVYLPPFKACVDEGCASIMTSFNDNDGLPSTGNRWLLTELLREQWGFEGVVVSDWGSVAGLIPHGVAYDKRDAAHQCIEAGCDVDMSSRSYLLNLKELIESGEVDMAVLDEAVRRVLRLKVALGLFEQPYARTTEKSDIYSESVLATACRLAEESVVMLKNEGEVLPLLPEKVKRVLVVGPMADAPYDQMGTWALDGDKTHTVTPIAAIREDWAKKVEIDYIPCLTHPRDRSTAEFARMQEAARKADVVVAFVGEEQMMSGEAHSLSSLDLQGAQGDMLEALAEVETPLVTVFMAGRPLTIARQVEISDAILYAWHPGTMGGKALANILFGEVSPSGKLPATFPRNVGQIPIYYNHKHTSHRAKGTEGNLDSIPREAYQSVMGHTSSYLDVAPSPLFPFGYGLSYTTFELSDIKIEKTAVTPDESIKVSVLLTNTGRREGTEVVQLYTGRKTASVTQPMKELKEFQRVTLGAGECRRVEFEVPVSRLAFHNRDMVLAVEEGKYTLTIGTDSQTGLKTYFKITK
ncbi:MAG: glycoside hydrolase family 3 C-terminal domain-containing protein [Tidjanibacter sp.]|nr:glycoside hydrolase family 3 C-terminal domain-containing protein [Tidjanibacter sp.]MBQ8272870.1 glycoside hydrolase family 3 C-terminal domain-containing protein [Tidjanibacter sp.]